MDFCHWDRDDLVLTIKVQPRASSDGFGEILGNAIKLRITAPPVDGKANQYLIGWLAKCFRVPRSRVILEKGETGRLKQVRIQAPRDLPAIIPPRE